MKSQKDLSALATAVGGLPVLGCLAGSPAANAGTRYGDILLSVDGTPTPTWEAFLAARAQCRGQFVARIFRDGEELELVIELRPESRSPLELISELQEMVRPAADSDGGGPAPVN